MEASETILSDLRLPPDIAGAFERAHAFLARKYDGVAPSPEELAIFYLSSVEAHEVVANLERQVLEVSGKTPPERDEHLLQTYLEMENNPQPDSRT